MLKAVTLDSVHEVIAGAESADVVFRVVVGEEDEVALAETVLVIVRLDVLERVPLELVESDARIEEVELAEAVGWPEGEAFCEVVEDAVIDADEALGEEDGEAVIDVEDEFAEAVIDPEIEPVVVASSDDQVM